MALIIAGIVGVTTLITSGITYLATRNSANNDNESIKGQITVVNEAHSAKNEEQDLKIMIVIALCFIITLVLAARIVIKKVFKAAERRISEREIALNNV